MSQRITSLLALTFAALGAGCASRPVASAAAPGTLVAIFAHPDDESIVSPALARYARDGTKVYVIVATDGRKGVSRHAGIPAGDSLAAVRAREARCSAAALGAQPPILFAFEDAGLAVGSPWPGEPMDRLAQRIDSTLRVLRPDAVITWGPEGGYGHADHRLVGDVVTQLFQSGAISETLPLYYVGFTADRLVGAPRWFGMRIYPTSPALLSARITYEEQDRAASRRALGCHRSQATEQQMDESFATLEQLWHGQVSFQQWRGGPVRSRLF
ncbi:MAG: PIG-L family deacetylase [Gemmatimonadaceae bacterium]